MNLLNCSIYIAVAYKKLGNVNRTMMQIEIIGNKKFHGVNPHNVKRDDIKRRITVPVMTAVDTNLYCGVIINDKFKDHVKIINVKRSVIKRTLARITH